VGVGIGVEVGLGIGDGVGVFFPGFGVLVASRVDVPTAATDDAAAVATGSFALEPRSRSMRTKTTAAITNTRSVTWTPTFR
jgi:hypothetical protein